MFEAPEGVWKFGVKKENLHLYEVLAMTLEEALKEVLDLRARCFLLSEQGRDLPVADSFATFADQELGIGPYTFCSLLDDRASGDLSMTVWACNFSIHSSSSNICLPEGAQMCSILLIGWEYFVH